MPHPGGVFVRDPNDPSQRLVRGTEAGQVLTWNGDGELPTFEAIAGDGIGDVSGPSSSVAGNLAAFDGTTGKLIADSGVAPEDFATAAALQAHIEDEEAHGGGAGGGNWGSNFVAPVDGDFAWINQGGATIASATVWGKSALRLSAPAVSGENVRLRKKAAPSTPYTVTIAFIPDMLTRPYHTMGLMWRESATSKLVGCCIGYNTDGFLCPRIYRWTNETTFSAMPFVLADLFIAPGSAGLQWLRLEATGTNLLFHWSRDGVHWRQLNTQSNTAFFTTAPDEIGFFASTADTSYTVGMTLLSWDES